MNYRHLLVLKRGCQYALKALTFALAPLSYANDDLLNMSFEDLLQVKVSIASGLPQLLHQAPAVASVITARDLENSGAFSLESALETIPALHVSHGSFTYAPRYFIRGIVSAYNPQTLVLINGIPQTSLFVGDRGERVNSNSGVPLTMIDRIEVIRGPGSALYGADAFSGVINIITRSPENAHGGDARVAYGSFNTYRASLWQTLERNQLKAIFSVFNSQSDGDNPILRADYQSNIDQKIATHSSLAPNSVNLQSQLTDIRTDVIWQDWQVRMAWRRSLAGTAHGINDTLDNDKHFIYHHITNDITWMPKAAEDWQPELQISYLYNDFRNPTRINLFPAGAFGGLFPDGVYGKPEVREENARINLTTLYHGWQDHQLRVGTGFYWGDMFEVKDFNNYEFMGLIPIPRPVPIDNSDTNTTFVSEKQRTNAYLFAQDIWHLSPDWDVTTGVRYDNFSDFGNTVNPRLAVVWQAQPSLTAKLLYGSAFRAPAFLELYGAGNPVALGNKDLQPEKLRSVEFALAWRPPENWSFDFNTYAYQIHDYIDFVNDAGTSTFTAQNIGRLKGYGFEAEWRYQPTEYLQWQASYSYQHTHDDNTKRSAGLTPSDKLYLRAIWQAAARWQISSEVIRLGKTQRSGTDVREALPSQTTLNLAIRRQWPHELSVVLNAQNVFDASVYEASRGPGPAQDAPSIPYDLPQTGRNLMLSVTKNW